MNRSSALTRTSLATLAFVTLSGTAFAQGAKERDFYVGATLGVDVIGARGYDVDKKKDASGRVSPGLFAGARLGTLPVASGWPVYVELGYQNIARHTVSYKVPGGTTDLSAKGYSLSAAAKVDAPLTERFGLYGKLGLARNSADSSTPAGQTLIDLDGKKTSALAAFGLQYAFDSGLTLRGELTSFGKTSKNSAGGGINLGAAYRF